MDRYIDIWWDGNEYQVNIRSLDGALVEYYDLATIEEVNELVAAFFENKEI